MTRYLRFPQWLELSGPLAFTQWVVLFLTQLSMGFLAFISPWLALALIVGLAMFLPIVYLSPVFVYLLILLSIPSYDLTFFTLGSFDLKLLHIFTLVGLGAWFIQCLKKGKIEFDLRLSDVPIFLIIGWAITTTYWTPVVGRSLFASIKIVGAFLTYFCMVFLIKDKEAVKRVLFIWVLVSFIWSIIGTYTLFFYSIPASANVKIVEEGVSHLGKTVRVAALFGKPNDYAFFLSIGILIAIAYLRSTASSLGKAFTIGTIIMMMLVLIGTFSRKSWLGYIGSIALMGLRNPRIVIGMAILLLISIAVLLSSDLSSGAYSDVLLNRVMSFFLEPEEGMAERTITWTIAVELFLKSPIVGNGTGAFMNMAPALGSPLPISHNFYLLILAEYGLIGLGLFLLFLCPYVFGLLRVLLRKGEDSQMKYSALALFAALTSVLFQAAFKTISYTNPIFLAFFALITTFLRVYAAQQKEI